MLLQLLQPIWLYAMTALAAPVIIHLWNRRPGKTLRVGSVLWVPAGAIMQKKRLHLSDILLLLLRCLLIAAVVLAMAAPVWRSAAVANQSPWLLLPRNNFMETYKRFRPAIDSMLQKGAALHFFESGFPATTLAAATVTADQPDSNAVSYRALVALLDKQLPVDVPVYIYSDNQLRHFSGRRTAVGLNLHWQTFTSTFDSARPTKDTSPITVRIYQQGYANDAHYLEAALEAATQFSGRRIRIMRMNDTAISVTKADWLCWLADMPPPSGAAKHVLYYAIGKVQRQWSWIKADGQPGFEPVRLYQSIEPPAGTEAEQPRWTEGHGRPMLSTRISNKEEWNCLYTHIDPAWNDLPWSASFPETMLQLFFGEDDSHWWQYSNAVIGQDQLMPPLIKSAAVRNKQLYKTQSLTGFCWLLALLLLLLERIISYRQTVTSVYG